MSITINKLGVIGAGAWGTALAKHLAEKGLEVRLWAYEHVVVNAINTSHENSVFLKGVPLPSNLTATRAACMLQIILSYKIQPPRNLQQYSPAYFPLPFRAGIFRRAGALT